MAQPQPKLTDAEYLAIDRKAETKSEFLDGEMYPLHGPDHPRRAGHSGEERRHDLVCGNLVRHLRELVKDPTGVLPRSSGFRVGTANFSFDPDVTVVCGDAEFTDDEFDTLTNPTVLVEVLSPSTADYDRGEKFENYRTIPSLQEVLLVDQDTVHIVRYRKLDGRSWILTETRDRTAQLGLESIDASLALEEVYAKVELDAPSAGPTEVA